MSKYIFCVIIIFIVTFVMSALVTGASNPDDLFPFEEGYSQAEELCPIQPIMTPGDDGFVIPEIPLTDFNFDPNRSMDDILAVSSKGGVIYKSEELINLIDSYRNADGLFEMPASIPEDLPVIGDNNPSAIIGPDDRFPIGDSNVLFPFKAIVQLEFERFGSEKIKTCTGWLVGPSSVITAAHCL